MSKGTTYQYNYPFRASKEIGRKSNVKIPKFILVSLFSMYIFRNFSNFLSNQKLEKNAIIAIGILFFLILFNNKLEKKTTSKKLEKLIYQ